MGVSGTAFGSLQRLHLQIVSADYRTLVPRLPPALVPQLYKFIITCGGWGASSGCTGTVLRFLCWNLVYVFKSTFVSVRHVSHEWHRRGEAAHNSTKQIITVMSHVVFSSMVL